MNLRNRRKKRNPSRLLGVEVEFESRARGATEYACSRTAALVYAPEWKLLWTSRGGYGGKGARPAATVLQLCQRNGIRLCCRELSWPAFNDTLCELTTLHILFNNRMLTINEWGWVSYEELWRSRGVLSVEISIILHVIRKPNSIIILLFIQNNS